MSENRKIMQLPPFPPIVCDECENYCVWQKYENEPNDTSWLICTRCGKEWHNFGNAVDNQIKEISCLQGGIEKLTDEALKD